MKTTPPEEIYAITRPMCAAFLQGEAHALAGTQPPGFAHGYDKKYLRDAYLLGMEKGTAARGEA